MGIPAAAVMTDAFVNAAELMAATLGAEGYGFAVIDHPIASATVDQLADQAQRAAEACLRLLVA